jgi:hypothetical protein
VFGAAVPEVAVLPVPAAVEIAVDEEDITSAM